MTHVQCIPRLPTAARRQRGFSLLEVLAAFVLFAVAFGGVLQLLAASMRNTRVSAEYTYAALWAQSKLDTVGVLEPLEERGDNGEFDDTYRWQLEVQRFEPVRETAMVDEVFSIDLYRVELIVSWGDTARPREARFVTLRSAIPDTL